MILGFSKSGAATVSRQSAFDAIRRCGLASNLVLCLDAGDATSYTSGQSWLDRSGNGHDFFLGADGSATATDPTFTGTAGSLSSSTYFSHDGGDYFTYDTTNETWMQNLHRDNAAFTALGFFYIGSTGGQSFFGTAGASATTVGASLVSSSGGQLQIIVGNGASSALVVASGANGDLAANAWNFVGVSLNEAVGSGGVQLYARNKVTSGTSTYSSPSSGNAAQTMQIGARGAGGSPLTSGSRIGLLCMWSAALTQGQVMAFRNALRGRYGV